MKGYNKEIRDHYDFFLDLISEKKIVKSKQIILEIKNNNRNWYFGSTEVNHIKKEVPISLLIEQSKRDNKYGIKLRCSTLTCEPFFRFDSDGPAHRNDDPSIPLDKQSITTPHFNHFNAQGKSIAYKTSQLLNENDSDAIVNDINIGLSHFCFETNISMYNNDLPEVVERSPELPIPVCISAFFNGAKFE